MYFAYRGFTKFGGIYKRKRYSRRNKFEEYLAREGFKRNFGLTEIENHKRILKSLQKQYRVEHNGYFLQQSWRLLSIHDYLC